ncbi:MAG: plasmid recombination protein [Christensenellales bacterium]|nr:plasmid recombination protein [Christensenellales bacterium]
MKRTISAMVGKGSVNHNSRKFKAENVDGERTHLNVDYCNEPIREVYHKLFDEARERYNARQPRADRKIEDYYEKIRSGSQEKPFHELILQIGNRDDTGAETQIGRRAKAALDEYYRGFQDRNPNLYVFSAHLHMDEATPHIHIDFVPFITGSKRGLDTRVSLKQALAAQGFRGGSRGATEWSQWVQAEKEQLARVMERHGFEWEQKGTHEQHLSVIDYKKQERSKELAAVEQALTEKQEEYDSVAARINNLEEAGQAYAAMAEKLDTDPDLQLPEPQGLMSAKSYKTRFVEPLIAKLKALIKGLLVKYFQTWDDYNRANLKNGRLYRENEDLTFWKERLMEDNKVLVEQNRDYALLRKVFGSKKIDDLVAQAREMRYGSRYGRDRDYER